MNHHIHRIPMYLKGFGGSRNLSAVPKAKKYQRDHTVRNNPTKLIESIEKVFADKEITKILRNAAALRDKLSVRREPVEGKIIEAKAQKYQQEMFGDFLSKASFTECESYEPEIKRAVLEKLRKDIYHWVPMEYNEELSAAYLLGRTPGEYATLLKIFKEIRLLDNLCQPQSCLDFGSGVGSVYWAMRHQYPNTFQDYLGVDPSRSMNDLARLLVLDGDPEKKPPLGFYGHRQKLPSYQKNPYDFVVSAFSLMEIPTKRERREIIESLWGKTYQYLIIVENGTHAGFRLVKEARDLIMNRKESQENSPAYTLAPCTHDLPCERLSHVTYNYPCSFVQKYSPFTMKEPHGKFVYSYVVLSKTRPESKESVARIIQPVLKKPRCVICRMCTSEGTLRELTFSKARHPEIFKAVKSYEWGDLFPYENEVSASKADIFAQRKISDGKPPVEEEQPVNEQLPNNSANEEIENDHSDPDNK